MAKTPTDDGEVEEYATAVEVNGIRRTLDAFMLKQEERNTSMESTLDKILGKIDKLSTRAGVPFAEDMGSNVKGKPTAQTDPRHSVPIHAKPVHHTNKSIHFGPTPQTNSRHFYTPPDSTRAQFITGTESEWTTRAIDSGQIDYDLIDCPWDDQELEVFFCNGPT